MKKKLKDIIWACTWCGCKFELKDEKDKDGLRIKPECPKCGNKGYVCIIDCLNKKQKENYVWYEDWKYWNGV